ncbi:hypothetical protein BJ742DRAFT_177102 [Cladochytrium replicatum]|nr:hypothetical protein BJ742DRAFT_177102 [Cladochytrium replicatum]
MAPAPTPGRKCSASQPAARKPTISLSNRTLHILIPDVIGDDAKVRSQEERSTHNSEKEDYIEELRQLSRDLDFDPVIHRMTLENKQAEIDGIPEEELIMNLCDGSDIDGVPGPSVAEHLESKKFPNIIGCDSLFINNTLTKAGMKSIFADHLVSSPPGFPATKATDLAAEVAANGMTYPLFVKISDSYGSIGLDDTSVCHDHAALQSKCDALFEKFENLVIEEYIDGPEFSVLISGNCRDPGQPVVVYPPAERAFNKDIPRFQRFISFLRNWDEALYVHRYIAVEDQNDFTALQDIARRAYIAVSGNCYGRVDIRKRDVNGKFYVLEVNASCGLGKGSSSDFILQLAGQTMKEFFQILLSSALQSTATASVAPCATESTDLAAAQIFQEPSPVDDVETTDKLTPLVPVIPQAIEVKLAKLLRNPSLGITPTPVIHVIVSAVLVDADSGIPDPEGKLAQAWGKDAEYVSELEGIFRSIGYDPIVHLYHVDDIESVLGSLDKDEDLVFNACLGQNGLEVAGMLESRGFTRTVGLNAAFFEESRDRSKMKTLLRNNRLRVPKSVVLTRDKIVEWLASHDNADESILNGVRFPVYIKPTLAHRQPPGFHSGRKIPTVAALRESLSADAGNGDILVEEYIRGREYRVLVAGDARDPMADVIVFPPIEYLPPPTPRRAPVSSSQHTNPAAVKDMVSVLFKRLSLTTLRPPAAQTTNTTTTAVVVAAAQDEPVAAAAVVVTPQQGTNPAATEEKNTTAAVSAPAPPLPAPPAGQNASSSAFGQWIRSTTAGVTKSASAIRKRYRPMKPEDLIVQMDVQDLSRRAFVAVHGSCYGLVKVIDSESVATWPSEAGDETVEAETEQVPSESSGDREDGLVVLEVSGDLRFGENSDAATVLQLSGLNTEALMTWLLKRVGDGSHLELAKKGLKSVEKL